MAKGRKPAIDGIARPQGFLDDIVRPVIQKGAKAVARKTLSPKRMTTYTKFGPETSLGRSIRTNPKVRQNLLGTGSRTSTAKERLGRKALDISNEVARKRSKAYESAARKAYDTGKSAKKVDVLSSKARAARNAASGLQNASVRKAAKGARRRGGYR